MPEPLTLNYAAPDADGLPVFVPEAEAIIDRGGGPSAIRKLFRIRLDATRYFAKSMSRRYDLIHAGADCCVCGRPATRFAIVEWNAKAQPHPFQFEITADANVVPFQTRHVLCEPCMSRWTRKADRYRGPVRWLGVLQWPIVGAMILMGIVSATATSIIRWHLLFGGLIVLMVARHLLFHLFNILFVRTTPVIIRRIRRRGMWQIGLTSHGTYVPGDASNPTLAVEAATAAID
jgi:hypothetical protein